MAVFKRIITCAALILLIASTICAALAEELLSAYINPNAGYEAFDANVSVIITNVFDYEILPRQLSVADETVDIRDLALASEQSFRIDIALGVDDEILDAEQLFVTLNYEYGGANLEAISSTEQILLRVEKLEDKVEAGIVFSLPDRPIDPDGDSVTVYYILDNHGRTDISNAVMTCEPGGYKSAEMYVPAGGFALVERNVPKDKLDEISASVNCQSAYSGQEYSFEAKYKGDILDTAVNSEKYLSAFDVALSEGNSQGDEDALNAENETNEPKISAEITESGIKIIVSAGNDNLTDVKIVSNLGGEIRTLAVLGRGLIAEFEITDAALQSGEYVFTMSGVKADGVAIEVRSEALSYEARAIASDEGDGFDALAIIADAPPIWPWVVGACGALVGISILIALVSRSKHKNAHTKEEENV